MTPEKIIEARNLLHDLAKVDGEIKRLNEVMRVGDCSIHIQLDSGKANEFRLTSCDINKTGTSLIAVMREIFATQRERILSNLKRLGVDI